jgi:phosphoribosylformylglycinamidine cyclo-ligase
MADTDGDLTYRSAGVDIDAGDEAVRLIKKDVERTYIPGVMGSLGGFAGLFALPNNMENPVLVTGTDGVGTKILLAIETGRLDTVGIDLVAMSVNDVLTVGARPLLFLDYVAAAGRDAPLSAAKWRRCRGSTLPVSSIWPVSAWAWGSGMSSSTARA